MEQWVNKDYVRQVLKNQVRLSAQETEFVPVEKMDNADRFQKYQQMVHGGRYVPSEEVIRREILDKGMDYRFMPDGDHPVVALRVRDGLPEKVAR